MAYVPKLNWANNDIVKSDDLNRMERGIYDSAQKDLANVIDAAFLAKAKKSNLAVFSAANMSLNVSPSGNDETGTGTSAYPFRTIQKALESFPSCNDKGVMYTLNVAGGSYSGFTLSGFKDITMRVSGSVIISGDIVVSSGSLYVSTVVSGSSLSISQGVIKVEGGIFDASVPLSVSKSTAGTGIAVSCDLGGHFGVKNTLTITNYDIAVQCAHSYLSIRKLVTAFAVSGIICDGGIVQMGSEEIQATTKFVIQHGGRIYVGAQTSLPNY